MTRPTRLLMIALVFGILPTSVLAHLDMTKPVSRYGPDILKTGPCGAAGGLRSGNINYFEPGETIDIEWNEYVDHPSHYRVAFDEDGDDDFVDPATMMEFYSNDSVLLDDIADETASDPNYRVSITLPDVECDNCTLQVIQVMYDKPPYEVGGNDLYYQCADLVLRKGGGAPGTDAGTDAGADAGTDAGTDAGADAGADAGTDADAGTGTGTDAGCSAARGNISWPGLGLWFVLLIAIRRLARLHRLPV